MKIIRKISQHFSRVFIAVLMATVLLSALALNGKECSAADPQDTVRILYIGNSMIYQCDMPAKIKSILTSMGFAVEYKQETPGGWYLTQHAADGSAARLDLQNGLNGYKWNYVIANGNTLEPAQDYTNMLAAAKTLKTDADKYNPGEIFILHSTNPYSPSVVSSLSGGLYTATNSMADDVNAKYNSIATSIGAKNGPNTMGMKKLSNDSIKTESDIWNADGKHHTEFSHYMAACIYAAMISGIDPTYFTENLSFSKADADYAKNVAKSVINSSNQGITLKAPVKIEAETMSLTNYTVESNTSATNGSLIKVAQNTTGTATKPFPGSTGKYNIIITYWDESDGSSVYNFYIGSSLIANWTANEATASTQCDSTTLRRKIISGVVINQNDTIKISSNYNGDEYGRVDVIDFIPIPTSAVATPTPSASTPTPTKAATSPTPTPTASKVIPGTIQAESYDTMSGVQTETTSDTGGGLNVGWIDAGDYMNYNVNVNTAGSFTAGFRVACPYTNTQLQLKNGTTVLAIVTIPNTGGFQTWSTVNTTISLAAGGQTLQVYAVTNGWNFNWMSFTSGVSSTSTPTPSPKATATPTPTTKPTSTPTPTSKATVTPTPPSGPTPVSGKAIPGQIQAESYDAMSGIQTETCSEGGSDVAYIDGGDWMDYNVTVQTTKAYTASFRVSSPYANTQLQLKLGSTILATIAVPKTGGWQTWQTATTTVNLNAGTQTLRVYAVTNGWNFNWMSF